MDATSLPMGIINARISEIMQQKYIRRIKSGTYIAIPYRIEEYVKKSIKDMGGKMAKINEKRGNKRVSLRGFLN